eukprot:2684677-Pyramimonas_sp.AAC.1
MDAIASPERVLCQSFQSARAWGEPGKLFRTRLSNHFPLVMSWGARSSRLSPRPGPPEIGVSGSYLCERCRGTGKG